MVQKESKIPTVVGSYDSILDTVAEHLDGLDFSNINNN